MRKILAVLIAAGATLALGTGAANAIPLAGKYAAGWYDFNAPIGGAYWFTDNIGIQAGFGFHKSDDGIDATDEETDFAVTAAVPIRLAGPETCHFYFRPGFYYESNPTSLVDSFLSVRGDLVVEYFLSHRFGIVGGDGVEFISESPSDANPNQETQTTFRTRPITSASVGFFYYFGGTE